jgi:uncharacterized protein (TIGR03437 family)
LSSTSRCFIFSVVATLTFFYLASWRVPLYQAAPSPSPASKYLPSTPENLVSVPQWRQLPGPGSVLVRAFLGSGQSLFAASEVGSVFRSANNGENWTRVNNGLTPRIGEKVYALAAIGTTIFAGTADGVFRSTNNADSWTKASGGLPNRTIRSLAVIGTTIFAGTTGAVFRSTNGGESWVATGALQTGSEVDALVVSGTTIFAGTTSGGVFRSTNNGDAWTAVNTGLTNLNVTALGVAGTNLFAATVGGGMFRSGNNGDGWTPVNAGLANLSARALAVIGTTLMAGTDDGVFRSTDNGQSWTAANAGLSGRAVRSLGAIGTTLYAGTNDGAFRSADAGRNWAGVNAGLSNLAVYSFAAIGANVFAGTNEVAVTDEAGKILSGGVYVTNDDGETWRAVNNGLTDPYVGALAVIGTTLFAATSDGVFRSTNLGESWTAINTGLSPLRFAGGLVAGGTALYVRMPDGVYRSTNNGDNWTVIRPVPMGFVTSLGASAQAVFAGMERGDIFRSTDGGQNWQRVYTPASVISPMPTIESFAVSGTALLAGAGSGGVLFSADGGTTWRAIGAGLPAIGSVAINGSEFYAATLDRVFLSTNQGTNWAPVNDGLIAARITCLAVIRSKLFAGTARKETVSGGSELGGSGALASDLGAGAVASVSAASFSGNEIAAESITAAFGAGLATQVQAATSQPLPTELAGTKVLVKDSAGVERLAPLFFVAPQQINYQMPAGMANGLAVVTVTSGDNKISGGLVQVSRVAPGVFSANSNGQGVAAATILRVKADGSQVFEPVARFDSAMNRFVSIPIDLGPETDQVFLILFGTGFRSRTMLAAVSATAGGTNAEVLYAGLTPGFVGLDQANIRLPRSLAGRGEIDVVLTVEGKTANPVRLNLR